MDNEELRDRLDGVLNPDPDDLPDRDFGHERLEKHHGLDTSYLETTQWEGSTMHPHTRLCSSHDDDIHTLTRNSDVSLRLFEAGLSLFADSIIAYHDRKERKGTIRYYPPIILTFWSGFETFVRHASELMLLTVPTVPEPIANYLRDLELGVDKSGELKSRTRYQSVLDRYAVFLRHAYGFRVDRGSSYWQNLEAARNLRDYYTHLDVKDPRAVTSDDVLAFMESTLLGLICPSIAIRRTVMLRVYRLYWQWAELLDLAEPYTEQPFFKDWYLKEPYQFHCNFDNVDESRFPSSEQIDKFKERLSEARKPPSGAA